MRRVHLVAALIMFAMGAVGNAEQQRASLHAELAKRSHGIVFESYDKNNWELFVVRADGSGRRKLTRTPTIHELYPQASPDGKRICFLADVAKDGNTLRSVYYMNSDGSRRVKVADRARQPCWSPDGQRIAFVKQEFSRFHIDDYVSKGLFFYDVKTGKTTECPNSKVHHLYGLTWSADGKWIVSTVHGGMGFGHAIIAIEVAGRRVFDLKIPGCRPCLSPDGKLITWSRNDHTVCVADVSISDSGARVTNTRVVARHKKAHLYHPDFSPDGRFISYSVGPGGRVAANGPGTHTQVAEMVGVRGPWNLFVKRADGRGSAFPLTNNANLSNKESEWIRRMPPTRP